MGNKSSYQESIHNAFLKEDLEITQLLDDMSQKAEDIRELIISEQRDRERINNILKQTIHWHEADITEKKIMIRNLLDYHEIVQKRRLEQGIPTPFELESDIQYLSNLLDELEQ